MPENNEFSVEATPVLARAESLSFDAQQSSPDVFGTGLSDADGKADATGFDIRNIMTPDAVDNEKTEILTDLDSGSDLAAYLVDLEGKKNELTGFPFKIGRDQQAALTLKSPGISRAHAEIIFESGRFVIIDKGSVNGIRVNGYKVSRVILENEDQVKIGGVAFKFQIGNEALTTAATSLSAAKVSAPKASVTSVGNTESKAPRFEMDFTGFVRPALFLLCGIVFVSAAVFGYKTLYTADRAQLVDVNVPPTASASAAASEAQPSSPAAANTNATNPVANVPATPAALSKPPVAAAVVLASAPGFNQSPFAIKVDQPKINGIPENAFVEAEVKPPVKKPTAKVSSQTTQARALLAKGQAQYMADRTEQYVRDLNVLAADQRVVKSLSDDMIRRAGQFNQLLTQYQLAKQSLSQGQRDEAAAAYLQFVELEKRANFSVKSDKRRTAESWLALHFFSKAEQAQSKGEHLQAYENWERSISLGTSTGAKVALANVDAKAKRLYRKALRLEYVNSTQAKANWLEVTKIVPATNEYHLKSREKLAWYNAWSD